MCVLVPWYTQEAHLYIFLLLSFHPIYILFHLPFFSPKIVNPLKSPVTWGCRLIKMCLKLAGHRVFWNAGIADSFAKLQNNPVSYRKIRTIRGFQVPVWLVYTFALHCALWVVLSSSSLFTVLTAKICHCSIRKWAWVLSSDKSQVWISFITELLMLKAIAFY